MTNGKSAPTAAQREWVKTLGSLATPVAGDGDKPRPGAADLIELTIAPENGAMRFGSNLQYKATAKTADGTERDVTNEVEWTSQDRAVVSIGLKNGMAVAMGAGRTAINARLDRGVDGDLTAAAAVMVADGPAPVRLIAITVTPERATLKSGEGKQFQAQGKFSNGKSEDVTTEVLWISGAPEVEIGNKGGFATAKSVSGEKTVTILAKHPEDPGTFGSASVTVTGGPTPPSPNKPVLKSISLRPPNATGEVGNLFLFLADGKFSDGTVKDVTKQVVFSSSNDAVLRFGGTNIAKAESAGAARVTAKNAATGITGSTDVTVKALAKGFVSQVNVTNRTQVVLRRGPDKVIKGSYDKEPDASIQPGATGTFSVRSGKDDATSGFVVWQVEGADESWTISYGFSGPLNQGDADQSIKGDRFRGAKPDVKGKDFGFALEQAQSPATGFVSHVKVFNNTQVVLLRGKDKVIKGSYEKEPDASIQPGATITFAVKSSADGATSGFVPWEVEGAKDEGWTISYGFSSALGKGDADQAIKGQRFHGAKPDIKDKDFGFALEQGQQPPPVDAFVSRVSVTNHTQVVLLRGKDKVIKGSYDKEPAASIRPGDTVTFSVKSSVDGATSGFVPWEVEGAKDESWTITYGFSGPLNQGDADQAIKGERFREVKPVVREKDFDFALEQGQPVPPPPPPQPQQQVAVSCLITVVNETQSVLTLGDPQNDRGEFFTQPQPTLKPGESTTFAYVQTRGETEPSKLGCKAMIFWEIPLPASGVWSCSWENLAAEKNKAVGEVITGQEGVMQSLAQAGQGDENVPFKFILRDRAR